MNSKYIVKKEEIIASQNSKKHQLVDATIVTPQGNEVVWQYVKSRDVVTVVALDDKDQIYCIKQWRPARNNYVWELPAGGIEVENPSISQVLENANRELQEEIGMKASCLEILTSYSPTIHMTSTYYVVLATKLGKSELPKDENEEVEVKKIPIAEAYDLFVNKQKSSSLTLVGILLIKQLIREKDL